MDVGSPFIPHADATEMIQPSEGAFHNPAPSPQPATMSGIAHCEQGQDVADTQGMADALRVVGPVSHNAVRATARSTTRSLERRNAIDQ